MLKPCRTKDLSENVFSLIGDTWMLITAGNREKCNTMTASWGGLGVLWGKDVATIYVRPQRFTYEFVEQEDCFTLSFFGEEQRAVLALCGSKSGRDMDKISACGLTAEFSDCGAPYFAEAKLVLVCKKMYFADLDPAQFLSAEIEPHYHNGDYHRMYIGEIAASFRAE